MAKQSKLAVVGFDSISLPFLETFVRRGVMPTVQGLMERGSTTQTWPFHPMETATNWACLATGASPAVHGCNMAMPDPDGPPDRTVSAFPARYCKAEQLWTAAHRAGKRSIVFDWTQSWPLAFEDDIVHVGEDGRPNFAIRALQESQAYTTDPGIPDSFHVRHVQPAPAQGWLGAESGSSDNALEFELPIVPTYSNPFWRHSLPTQYQHVRSLWARVEREGEGYGRVALYAAKDAEGPLLVCRPGRWSEWARHTFVADGEPVPAHVRGKLLALSPDGTEVHLYLSEIYPAEGFVHPARLGPALLEACGPYVIQCSRQQAVIGSASDIATYFEEQMDMGRWYRAAAEHLLQAEPWDLFMFKWHGPDWTNHLAMYMIDPHHAMYDPARAEEGWAYWDRLMGLGDEIVRTVVDAAGEGATIALVSDHGGNTNYGGPGLPSVNALLEAQGLLAYGPEGVDWTRSRAYNRGQYVYLNTVGRTPHGQFEPGSAEYHALRAELIETLLDLKDETGRHAFQAVLPIEDAARLGVAGSFAGDLFLLPRPQVVPTREEFYRLHPAPEQSGTWDWPRLNSGGHSDDSYLILCGPGVRQGYRRPRPTWINSVAPTLATAAGLPVPRDADGTVLQDFWAHP